MFYKLTGIPINHPDPPGLLGHIPVLFIKTPLFVTAHISLLPTLICLKPVVFGAESKKKVRFKLIEIVRNKLT